MWRDREEIQDEFVAYRVYCDHQDFVSEAALAKQVDIKKFTCVYLGALRLAILSFAEPLLQEYIWHQEAFELTSPTASSIPQKFSTIEGLSTIPLCGRTVFSDGLEDEWFIVSVLFKISLAFPALLITVSDNDGDFLLIEAAEHLPEWLEPESSANRVFIHNGSLHIVKPDAFAAPSLQESLKFICQSPGETIASSSIQNAIKAKLQNFNSIPPLLHRAKVVVPRTLAQMLTKYPKTITNISKSFARRDSARLSSASRLNCIKGADGSLDLLAVRVAFSRSQFAYLACQNIHPPRGYPVPNEQDPEYLAFVLGFKLALGAELAILEEEEQLSAQQGVHLEDEAIERARAVFALADKDLVKIQKLLSSIKISSALREESLKVVEVGACQGPDDDLTWMNVEDGHVMNELDRKMQGMQLSGLEIEQVLEKMSREEEEARSSKTFVSMKKFLDAQSGIDGIEYDAHAPLNSTDSEGNSDDYTSESGSQSGSESSENSEDDVELLEREILEAANHDPDLMMKILERASDFGLDNTEFLSKLKELASAGCHATREGKKPAMRQKGVADIDPLKLAEARIPTRVLRFSGQTQGEQPDAPANLEESGEKQASCASDSENYDDAADGILYMKHMDDELHETLEEERLCATPSKVEAHMHAASTFKSGPAHTLLLSINKSA